MRKSLLASCHQSLNEYIVSNVHNVSCFEIISNDVAQLILRIDSLIKKSFVSLKYLKQFPKVTKVIDRFSSV